MSTRAEKTNPKLWDKVKRAVTEGDKGGKPGQWSARKAQLAVHDYKAEGGGYKGGKSADNHLVQWTGEDWGTKSGADSGKTGERYLPRKTRERLTENEYARTTAKKREDSRRGEQFSRQPKDVAEKAAEDRLETLGVAELRRRAAAHRVAGRSKMKKAELVSALAGR